MQFNSKSLVIIVAACVVACVGLGYGYKFVSAERAKQEQLELKNKATERLRADALHGKEIEKTIEAKCVSVSDGDTLYAMIDGEKVHVRLEGIDCPEGKQPLGKESTQEFSDLVLNKTITLHKTGTDRWGMLAFVVVDDINLSEHLIQKGLGWHYKKRSTSEELADLEKVARAAKIGIWAGSQLPIAPWEWRASRRQKLPQFDEPIQNGLTTPNAPPTRN